MDETCRNAPPTPESALFSSGDASTYTGSSPGTKIYYEKLGKGKGEKLQVERFPKELVAKRNGPQDIYQAAGTVLPMKRVPTLPVSEFLAMDISPAPREVRRKPEMISGANGTPLATVETETISRHPLSTRTHNPAYSVQGTQMQKLLPVRPPLTMTVPRMSPVSTGISAISIDTTLDYSLFTLQPHSRRPRNQQSFEPQNSSGNPQLRPKQFIQQSARRPANRILSPRRASFIAAQKSHWSNGRRPGRRVSTKNPQYQTSGKQRVLGNTRNTSISSVSVKRVQVIRPSRKPVLVGIPASSQSPVKRMPNFPTVQISETQQPLAKKSAVPPSQNIIGAGAIAHPPKGLPNKDLAIPQEPPAPMSPTPLPKHILGRSNDVWPRPATVMPTRTQRNEPSEPRSASAPPSVIKIRSVEPFLASHEERGMRTVERGKMGMIPDILRIGNKQNSSLSQRLTSLESLDVRSRY